MARNISVADDVYEWMDQNRGDQSFSEFIRSLKHRNTDFSSVSGLKITGEMDTVEETIEEASEQTMASLKNKTSSR